MLIVLLIVGTAVLAERSVLHTERTLIRDEVQRDVSELRAEIERLFTADIQIARALVAYVRSNPDLDQAEFQAIAPYLLEGSSGAVRNIALARDLTISHTYPFDANAASIGFSYRTSESQWPMVAQAIETRQVTLAGPLDLVQGGRGVIVRFPIFLDRSGLPDGDLWGIASLVIDKPRFLEEVGALELAERYHLAITSGADGDAAEAPIFRTEAPPGPQPVTVPVAVNGQVWRIVATPADGWPRIASLALPIALLAGLFLAAFGYLGASQARAERKLIQQSIALDDARRDEAKARQAAEAANHSKTLFLANMSHELRTPLNAIIGFTDVIRGEMLGPVGTRKYLEYLKDIGDASSHLLSVLSDILDIARVEVGRVELVESRVTIPSLVESTLSLTSEAASTHEKTILASIPDDIPAVRVDARLMRQVLTNLVNNAINHTPPGTRIVIGARLETVPATGDEDAALDPEARQQVVISVADNGPGLPPGIGDRILEPFVRGSDDPYTSTEGSGLGLAIATRIMGLHGGALWIDEDHKPGVKINLTLPPTRLAPIPPREITDGTAIMRDLV